ncbi:hypothetical protein F3Y22_tig00004072pilonHSYRG00117 [Hibiscus syriacus]|uniref:Uncharacterized protein n=1 Tax=Hibiscus syriacus TaxID=106335 RepID=A0A6A3CJ28_HIBSY|nr:hypothetical protein F3Y22_tig00004072pilonHSYRG00117 [Hibiscus syriacus]
MGEIERVMEGLQLGEEEEAAFNLVASQIPSQISFDFCLVGRFLTVAQQFDNFIGSFIEYDSSIVSLGYSSSLRIRVGVDTRKSLKMKNKLALSSDQFTYATFQCEKLRHLLGDGGFIKSMAERIRSAESYETLKLERSGIRDASDVVNRGDARDSMELLRRVVGGSRGTS